MQMRLLFTHEFVPKPQILLIAGENLRFSLRAFASKFASAWRIVMHMSDALVSPAVGGAMFALSGIVAGYSIHKLKKEENLSQKIPSIGVMGAFVFATQMINFTIPGTGSSGHLCGGLLLSAVLGPYAGFLSMIGVLFIQALFFADGGLLALGGNIWNMSFYGCFIGTLIWKYITNKEMSRKKIWFASILGSIVTLQMGAFSVVFETKLSGVTELPFGAFMGAMLPIHLAIGLVEGVITASVLSFVYEARPELLQNNEKTNKEGKLSYKKTIIILVMLFVIIGGGMSLLASANPDGLEWSIEKLTGNTDVEAASNAVYGISGRIQKLTSILPDYNFKTSQSSVGTSVSGIIGCGIVTVFLMIIGYIVKAVRKKERIDE